MTHEPLSRATSLALLCIGIISGIFPSLQGTLLPELVKEGKLTLAGLGQVAMAEAIGTFLAVSLASAMLQPRHLRLYVLAAATIGLALDLTTARLTGHTILAARFAHGLCAGMLLWVWIGFLTRCKNPGRWVAGFAVVQSTALLLLSTWFFSSLLPKGGANAGFAIGAGLYGLVALLTIFTPPHFQPITHESASTRPSGTGWFGLFGVFSLTAAILATWVYLKPYGRQIGLDETITGLAVTAAMGAQIASGLIGMAFAGHVRNAAALLFVVAASIASLVLLLSVHSAFAFVTGTAAFAFFWTLGSPFYMPYLIDIDPSRRSALHMLTSQLLGVAAGPAMASMAVHGQAVTGALIVAAALYVLGALIVGFTVMRAGHPQKPLASRHFL